MRVTRVFSAPRELVFQAWCDPASLARWWGPQGFEHAVCDVDPRPGGVLRIVMRGPGGVYAIKGVLSEFVPPERLVFTGVVENSALRHETAVTLGFSEQDGNTTVSLWQVILELALPLAAGPSDWVESLDRLKDYLATLCSADCEGRDG